MGLDQCAYTRTADELPDEVEPKFIWRKQAKLQHWAEELFIAKTGEPSVKLNCGELPLDADDIHALKEMIEGDGLPTSNGGFFFGHQFQDESEAEYREQDLAFCHWALAENAQGQAVYYSCWW